MSARTGRCNPPASRWLDRRPLDRRFTLGARVLAFRAHRRSIDLAVDVLRQEVAKLVD